jgi:hypothetical protein
VILPWLPEMDETCASTGDALPVLAAPAAPPVEAPPVEAPPAALP